MRLGGRLLDEMVMMFPASPLLHARQNAFDGQKCRGEIAVNGRPPFFFAGIFNGPSLRRRCHRHWRPGCRSGRSSRSTCRRMSSISPNFVVSRGDLAGASAMPSISRPHRRQRRDIPAVQRDFGAFQRETRGNSAPMPRRSCRHHATLSRKHSRMPPNPCHQSKSVQIADRFRSMIDFRHSAMPPCNDVMAKQPAAMRCPVTARFCTASLADQRRRQRRPARRAVTAWMPAARERNGADRETYSEVPRCRDAGGTKAARRHDGDRSRASCGLSK